MTAPHRLPTIPVFDADGNELVGYWQLRHWGIDIPHAPDPVGVFNGHPVWRRIDIEPMTLFPKDAT